MLILTTKKLTTPLRSVVQPEWLKALNDGIKQERRVRQQHRTESLKTLNDGISTRFYVRQSLVVGTATTIHSIDCIRYLSTTTKCQPEMPDYVNNNIWGTSQLLRSTRYQVSGRKKDREINKRKSQYLRTNTISIRSTAVVQPGFDSFGRIVFRLNGVYSSSKPIGWSSLWDLTTNC